MGNNSGSRTQSHDHVTIESLRFQNASFSYNDGHQPILTGHPIGQRPEEKLIHNLSLALPMNKNIWITGTAGQGQSTFIKLLAVLLQPNEGQYFINELDTTQMSFEEFLPLRLRIGYTFDFGGLFANRTLFENFLLPILYHKTLSEEAATEKIHLLAARFRFSSQLMSRPAVVSGGLRKLACVLRAILLDPEMLVMDDPFTALDHKSAQSLIDLVEEGRSGGRLRHVFLTSRDHTWPETMGCEPLIIDKAAKGIGQAA